MYLYYQDLYDDSESQLIGEYETTEELVKKIKQICNDGHDICPNYIPTYDEYISGNLGKYLKYLKNYEYLFYIPTNEEINNLNDDDFIYIIKNYFDDEYTYYVSKKKINNYEC